MLRPVELASRIPASFMAALLVAVVIAIPLYVIQPIVFTNDSVGYVEGARALIRAPDGRYSYWRTPLFPVLMALTGTAQQWTLHGLVFVHLLLGLAMPIAVYLSLMRMGCTLAVWAAVATSLSLTPFTTVGYVMPQQLYYFMLLLATCFTFRYIIDRKPSDIYAIALAGLAAVMVRPQGSYLFLFLILVALIAEPRRWKRCAAAAVVALGTQFAYMAARPYFVHAIAPSDEVLLSDLKDSDIVPNEQAIYRRGMLFVRNNLIDDGRTIANFVSDPKRAGELRLAAYAQSLLINDPPQAERHAREESDQVIRDRALSLIALHHAAQGNTNDAHRIVTAIGAPEIRAQTKADFTKPFKTPVLTSPAPTDGRIKPRRYVNSLDLTDTGGKMMLFPVLLTRSYYPDALIVPENGPASARLYWLLDQYIRGPGVLERLYPNLGRFISYPERGIRPLLTQFGTSAAEVHWTVWQMLERLIGPSATNRLLTQVVFEFAKRYPLELGEMYLRFAMQAFLGRQLVEGSVDVVALPQHPDVTNAKSFQKEIAASKRFIRAYENLTYVFIRVFPNIGLVITLLAMCGIAVIRTRRAFLVWATCWIVVMHQVGICALTAGTGYLYTSIIFIPLVIAGCITIFELIRRMQIPSMGAAVQRTEPRS